MTDHSSEQTILRSMLQILDWGAIHQERFAPADTMYTLTGRRLYVIGDIDGQFRPRSNPYDLHAFGKPDPNDPLADRLQGIWAQPVKGFNGYEYSVMIHGERWDLREANRFTQTFATAQFEYQFGPLAAVRQDFVAQDLPFLVTSLALTNHSQETLELTLTFTVHFDLADAWFTTLGERRNAGQLLTVEEGCLVARAEVLPAQWAAAVGAKQPGAEARVLEERMGTLTYTLRLAPGGEETLRFGLAVESQGGAEAAVHTVQQGLANAFALQAETEQAYQSLFEQGPHLVSPNPSFNAAFDLARANLRLLEAESPALGRYFYAGLEMFPFWFSNDGAYSLVGMLSSGMRATALNHLRIGLRYLEAGRVPHQISPSGKLAFQGNAQETPLWVISLWDAYRWTGDQEFLAQVYPGALTGMFDYVLGQIDPDGDGYPSGPGMVEADGMGPEKLDSAAYTWAALRALANMAQVLGDQASADQALERAEQIGARFEADWWDAQGGTYAISLQDPGNALYPVPHWAVVVPLEVGLAAPRHAAATFATLRAQYLNRWGLKHTVGDDERVWTLPTLTLSRAAYRYGEPELGFEMLQRVTETLNHGSIGLFHELIPDGACFIQLWSGAAFLRGIIEDLLGIEVDAAGHSLRITPRLPQGWDSVGLEGLNVGAHTLSLRISSQVVSVAHLAGPTPLAVTFTGQGESCQFTVEPGKTGESFSTAYPN